MILFLNSNFPNIRRYFKVLIIICLSNYYANSQYVRLESIPVIYEYGNGNLMVEFDALNVPVITEYECQFGVLYREKNVNQSAEIGWIAGKNATITPRYKFIGGKKQTIRIQDIYFKGKVSQFEFRINYFRPLTGRGYFVNSNSTELIQAFNPFVYEIKKNNVNGQLLQSKISQIRDGLEKLKFSTNAYLFLFNSIDEVEKQLDTDKIDQLASKLDDADKIIGLVGNLQSVMQETDDVRKFFGWMKILTKASSLPAPFSKVFLGYAQMGEAFYDAILRINNNLQMDLIKADVGLLDAKLVLEVKNRKGDFLKREQYERLLKFKFVAFKDDKDGKSQPYALIADPSILNENNQSSWQLFPALQHQSNIKVFLRIELTNFDYSGKEISGPFIFIPLDEKFTRMNGYFYWRAGIQINSDIEAFKQLSPTMIKVYRPNPL